jgi:hypothetical protein
MFENIIIFLKNIYEKISDRYNNIVIDQKRLLEENSYYCRMMDGGFSLKSDEKLSKKPIQNHESYKKDDKIKERMESYRR